MDKYYEMLKKNPIYCHEWKTLENNEIDNTSTKQLRLKKIKLKWWVLIYELSVKRDWRWYLYG